MTLPTCFDLVDGAISPKPLGLLPLLRSWSFGITAKELLVTPSKLRLIAPDFFLDAWNDEPATLKEVSCAEIFFFLNSASMLEEGVRGQCSASGLASYDRE